MVRSTAVPRSSRERLYVGKTNPHHMVDPTKHTAPSKMSRGRGLMIPFEEAATTLSMIQTRPKAHAILDGDETKTPTQSTSEKNREARETEKRSLSRSESRSEHSKGFVLLGLVRCRICHRLIAWRSVSLRGAYRAICVTENLSDALIGGA